MLKKLFVGLVVLAVVVVGIGFLLPREVHVERTAVIKAPQATLFTLVNSFGRYNEWSPWAAKDPQAEYTFSGPRAGVGAKMSWVGDPKTVGRGSQEIVVSRPFEVVEMALDFGDEGPAKAAFQLGPDPGGVKVTWTLDTDLGNNPIARYFGTMFDSMVGPDYEQGLANLAALAQRLPPVDFAGLAVETVEVAPQTIAYVEASATMDDAAVAAAMGQAYAQVTAFIAKQGLTVTAPPISVNTKWDDSGVAFEAGIPIDHAPAQPLPAGSAVKVKQSYTGKALKAVHKGPYREMDETMAKLIAYAATTGAERAGAPWDEYVSDPQKTPEPELITNLFLPVK